MKILKIILCATLIFFITSCQKEYSEEIGDSDSSGSWEFKAGSLEYKGVIDSAVIETVGGTKILKLEGRAFTGQENFSLLLFSIDTFTVGNYRASLSQSEFDYFTSAKTIYRADFLTGEFIVNITTISNGRIEGTFSGQTADSSGNVTQISLGKFSSTIDLTGNGTGGGAIAVGTLGAEAGVCTSVLLAGDYIQGTALSASNTAQVEVNVTTPGTYTLVTNIVNGVSFSASGTFTATGAQNVILGGTGVPVEAGEQNFTVAFGASTCVFPVTFSPGTLITAIGTLGAVTGNCTPVNIAGVYTQGISLATSNTVQVEVNVTTAGTYAINTNTVTGVSFSATGTFSSTGVQNVTLTGTGTPESEGAQIFTITFGTSTCDFTITFLPNNQVNFNYFPTTPNSNWTYGLQGGNTSDSLLVTVSESTATLDGQVYSIFSTDVIPPSGSPDTSYFRKEGHDYYESMDPSQRFGFDESSQFEYIFLKDNVPAGTSFDSEDFTGTISGIPISGYVKITILEKDVQVTVGALLFSNVIKVKYEYFVIGFQDPEATEERWFAPDVGLIHINFDEQETYNIGRYQVF